MYDRSVMDKMAITDIWEDTSVDLLERIRKNDTDAIVQFVMTYQNKVRSVVQDVLQDEARSVLATRTTFKNAVRQIQNGVRSGQMEPWLFWIARNEALTLTQAEVFGEQEEQKNVPAAADRITVSGPQVRSLPFTGKTLSPFTSGTALRVGQSAVTPERTSEEEANASLLAELKRLQDRNAQLEAETAQPNTAEKAYSATRPANSPSATPYRYVPKYSDTPVQPQSLADREPELPTRKHRQDDAYRAEESYAEPERSPQRSKNGMSIINILITCGMVLVILLLVWVVMGLLAKNNIISIPDWGFSWFNQHLFNLF